MYLVDTSAWLEYGRKHPRPIGVRLKAVLESGTAVFVSGVIVQEVLQGARDALHFQRMREWFAMQRLVPPLSDVDTYVAAARLYAQCRWRGITPRSGNDCLIAQLAVERDLTLLHDDSDFEKIAGVEPRLKLA